MKKVLVLVLALAMVLSTMGLAVAEDPQCVTDGALTFENANIKVGETKTISVTTTSPMEYVWYVTPSLYVGGDVYEVDLDITCKVDGVEVDIDKEAAADGALWWHENCGDFTMETTIRTYGSYNEWGTAYIAKDALDGASKIEYTITLNSIEFTDDTVTLPADGAFAFISIGADKDHDIANEWYFSYAGTPATASVVDDGGDDAGDDAPKTADAMNIVLVAGLAVVALAGSLVVANKKNA